MAKRVLLNLSFHGNHLRDEIAELFADMLERSTSAIASSSADWFPFSVKEFPFVTLLFAYFPRLHNSIVVVMKHVFPREPILGIGIALRRGT